MINNGKVNPRSEVVNVDDVFGFGSLIHRNFKFLNGTVDGGIYDGWLGARSDDGVIDSVQYAEIVLESEVSKAIYSVQAKNLTVDEILKMRKAASVECSKSDKKQSCDLTKNSCLFDILEDACEENNLADARPLLKMHLQMKYFERTRFIVHSRMKESDAASDPVFFNCNWNWWQPDSKSDI